MKNAKESGPVDEAVLWFFRNHVPAELDGFFEVVTLSGSARFLVPLSALAAIALLVARRRFEALLMAASVVTATLVVWGMKALVGRARPALWEAQWYWGSSFPSGHTLSTAAFVTAAALCVARIWPRAGSRAMALAVLRASAPHPQCQADLPGGRRALVTCGFGLIHGFGFGGVLAELDLPVAQFAHAVTTNP